MIMQTKHSPVLSFEILAMKLDKIFHWIILNWEYLKISCGYTFARMVWHGVSWDKLSRIGMKFPKFAKNSMEKRIINGCKLYALRIAVCR